MEPPAAICNADCKARRFAGGEFPKGSRCGDRRRSGTFDQAVYGAAVVDNVQAAVFVFADRGAGAIIMGDMNARPRSPTYQVFADAGLEDACDGTWYGHTWPSVVPQAMAVEDPAIYLLNDRVSSSRQPICPPANALTAG